MAALHLVPLLDAQQLVLAVRDFLSTAAGQACDLDTADLRRLAWEPADALVDQQACAVCGCTEHLPCVVDRRTCSWVALPSSTGRSHIAEALMPVAVCSACVYPVAESIARAEFLAADLTTGWDAQPDKKSADIEAAVPLALAAITAVLRLAGDTTSEERS